jgi:hypothetical protein
MLVLTALRNDIAHGDKRERRAIKIGELRHIMSGMGTEEFRACVKTADDRDIVVYAAAMASGFLLVMEEQLAKIRNPGEESDE